MKVIKHIISFILMLCILASVLIGVVANTVASKDYIIRKLNEIDFYNGIKNSIEEGFKDNIMQSGMDETIFQDIFTIQKLEQDINNVIDCVYENKGIEVETESIRTNLKTNIDKYVEEHNLNVNNESELNIFINTIVSIYENSVVYSKSVITKIAPTTSKVINIIHMVQPFVYITTAIFLIILILTNLKVKSDIAKYVGISLLASGMILLIAKIYITTQINIEYFSVMGETITNLIQTLVNQILNSVFYIGIALIIVSVILLIIKIVNIKTEKVEKSDNTEKIEKPQKKGKRKPKH